jgi:hypothetical protein
MTKRKENGQPEHACPYGNVHEHAQQESSPQLKVAEASCDPDLKKKIEPGAHPDESQRNSQRPAEIADR